jgi:hypothetical protein
MNTFIPFLNTLLQYIHSSSVYHCINRSAWRFGVCFCKVCGSLFRDFKCYSVHKRGLANVLFMIFSSIQDLNLFLPNTQLYSFILFLHVCIYLSMHLYLYMKYAYFGVGFCTINSLEAFLTFTVNKKIASNILWKIAKIANTHYVNVYRQWSIRVHTYEFFLLYWTAIWKQAMKSSTLYESIVVVVIRFLNHICGLVILIIMLIEISNHESLIMMTWIEILDHDNTNRNP